MEGYFGLWDMASGRKILKIRIESSSDRSLMSSVLIKNGYKVWYEKYTGFDGREDDEMPAGDYICFEAVGIET